jgi:hypothetical protein
MDQEPVRHTKNIAALMLGVVFVGLPLYLVVGDRSEPIETTNFRIEPSTVYPGQKVETVRTSKTLRAGCDEGHIHQRIISKEQPQQVFSFVPIPPAYSGPVGTVREYHSQPWQIPLGLPLGKAVLEQTPERGCNWLQRMVWPIESTRSFEFTVVAKPGG